jgi:hypothetical protein
MSPPAAVGGFDGFGGLGGFGAGLSLRIFSGPTPAEK